MRRPSLVLMAVFLVWVNACGRMNVASKQVAPNGTMSEIDAMNTLTEVPLTASNGRSARGAFRNISAEQLAQLLQDLAAQGKLNMKNTRGAVSSTGSLDLSTLNSIFSLLQSGQANSLFGLAQGLLSLNGGNTGSTGSKINTILAILQAALPIIATVAPQFAPIIQALITILPLVVTFISMFKKPAPQPTASYFYFGVPVRA